MSEYTIDELHEFEETVLARIQEVQDKMEELEDIMNSGDEQIALQERLERLMAKHDGISRAIAEHTSQMDFDDDDDVGDFDD